MVKYGNSPFFFNKKFCSESFVAVKGKVVKYRDRLELIETNPKLLKDPIFIALADTVQRYPVDIENFLKKDLIQKNQVMNQIGNLKLMMKLIKKIQ